MPLDNRLYEPPSPASRAEPRNAADMEQLYALAALNCYRDSLRCADPEEAENLIAAGAWFARLGQIAEG